MTIPRRISLNGSCWQVQGWIPCEWDLVGPVRLATGGLDVSKVLHGETAPIPATFDVTTLVRPVAAHLTNPGTKLSGDELKRLAKPLRQARGKGR